MKVFPQTMMRNVELTRGLVFSQRVLLELIERGASREEAYEVVQRHAHDAWDNGTDFRELLRVDPLVQQRLSPNTLDSLFDYGYYTQYIEETFKRVGL